MRRTIKFRGKANNGRWVYGGLVYSNNIEPAIYFEVGNKVCRMEWAYVDPATVGQFTGLTDKNGTPIYEGDIIRHKDMVKPYYVIYDGHQFTTNDGFRSLSYPKHWEVIGNVFDNSDLIEKGGK